MLNSLIMPKAGLQNGKRGLGRQKKAKDRKTERAREREREREQQHMKCTHPPCVSLLKERQAARRMEFPD